jgi:transcriptional regulator with XRE-family HTH domain
MSLIESCGRRIKYARQMLGLSRLDLQNQFDLSINTLNSWESDKNPLTNKGAKKLNEVFIKLGLLCSEAWLLTGVGSAPLLMQNFTALPNEISEDICILREIEAFKAINPDPLVVIINDNGMEPIYSIGDYVGGNKKSGLQIDALIGQNCIIETLQGDTFVRKILNSKAVKLYNLACINIMTDQQPLIPNIQIRSAARIVLHRRK